MINVNSLHNQSKTMKNISDYIESCLIRGGYQKDDRAFDLTIQCQSCSGSAQEKLGAKIILAELGNMPTYVVYFGNGFTSEFIEKMESVPIRGNYLGLNNVADFCQQALNGLLLKDEDEFEDRDEVEFDGENSQEQIDE
jgi:hypothetical protein